MAYTVDDAIAAVVSAQAAETNPNKGWFIQASVTIADTPLYAQPGAEFPTRTPDEGTVELDVPEEGWAPITGEGPLYMGRPTPLFGNLGTPVWNADKFKCQRGGGLPFWLGMDIDRVITFIGPLPLRPPVFARSFVQRHGLVSRKHFSGVWALHPQLRFSVRLTEDPKNPKLTGAINPDPSLPGAIHPPATIEVVLESLASGIIA